MYLTIIVYLFLMLFMILCFVFVRQYSPYSNISNEIKSSMITRLMFFLAFFVFAIVCGIRYDVGADHLHYLDAYLNGFVWKQKEILYSIINNIFAINKIPYPIFFGFLAFIQVSFFFLAFRKDPRILIWLTIFLFLDGMVGSWNNIIRASIAGCIWIYSIDYISEKKPINYYVLNFIAIGFHTSAILLLITYPLLFRGKAFFKSVGVQYILLAVALVIRFSFGYFSSYYGSLIEFFTAITGAYDNYKTEDVLEIAELQGSTSLAYYFILLLNIVVIAFSRKMHTFYNSNKFNIIYNIYFIGVLTFYIFPGGLIALTRPFRYFYFFRPIILAFLAYYLYSYRRIAKYKLLLITMLLLYSGIFCGSIILSGPDSHVKYQIFSQHPEVSTTPSYEPHSVLEN